MNFWRIVKEHLHAKVFATCNASLVERVFYFKACAELYKEGYGTDYTNHPLNPL